MREFVMSKCETFIYTWDDLIQIVIFISKIAEQGFPNIP